ncbi:unnamed protein product [Musa textilis]
MHGFHGTAREPQLPEGSNMIGKVASTVIRVDGGEVKVRGHKMLLYLDHE